MFLHNDFLILPPELNQSIFTDTFDSYCLAHILYYLYSGEFVKSAVEVPGLEESVWFSYS